MKSRVIAAVTVMIVSCGVLAAQDDTIDGVRMDFYETRTRAGEFVREMSGSFFLATNGDWRLDRTFRGERISVLSLAGNGEQIEINHDLGLAVRGAAAARMTVPTVQGYGPTIIERVFSSPPLPAGAAQRLMTGGAPSDGYGQRAVGPLLLDGDGWAMGGHEIERWTYRLPDNARVTLEYTATHTDENGVQTVDERRVTRWERVAASRDTFALPGGMDVYSRWPDERQPVR